LEWLVVVATKQRQTKRQKNYWNQSLKSFCWKQNIVFWSCFLFFSCPLDFLKQNGTSKKTNLPGFLCIWFLATGFCAGSDAHPRLKLDLTIIYERLIFQLERLRSWNILAFHITNAHSHTKFSRSYDLLLTTRGMMNSSAWFVTYEIISILTHGCCSPNLSMCRNIFNVIGVIFQF
jgi:hypothetical protein